MARLNVTTHFKKLLLQFVTEQDPLLAMLQWLTQQLMQLEAESKVGAEKNKHSKERNTYFSGYRVRRFDTRMGTLYLMVPKLRNGGYVPFFVIERKRSEQALVQVIQEAFINGVSTCAGTFISGHRHPTSFCSFLLEDFAYTNDDWIALVATWKNLRSYIVEGWGVFTENLFHGNKLVYCKVLVLTMYIQ